MILLQNVDKVSFAGYGTFEFSTELLQTSCCFSGLTHSTQVNCTEEKNSVQPKLRVKSSLITPWIQRVVGFLLTVIVYRKQGDGFGSFIREEPDETALSHRFLYVTRCSAPGFNSTLITFRNTQVMERRGGCSKFNFFFWLSFLLLQPH